VGADGCLDDGGEPLIPDVERLTDRVLGSLEGVNATAAAAVRQGLGNRANIETILSRVRLLQNALDQVEVNGLNGDGYKALASTICGQIGRLAGVKLPQQRNPYTELVAWVGGTTRPHAVEIFTTNYDLLFEEAFERARSAYFDGFTGGSSPFFDPVTVAGNDLPPRWTRLWKLHGSIGWVLEDGNVVRRGGRSSAELVYPDHLKYDLTKKQPYTALFERLRQFLLTPDSLLLAVGFSFNDAHVSAVIDESLAMNANSSVFAFQFKDLEEEEAVAKIACQRPNLSVYAKDGAVIGAVPSEWRLGELPKNWENIRQGFWGIGRGSDKAGFLLGDFARLARFCALSQASELRNSADMSTASSEARGNVSTTELNLPVGETPQ
jgi:hypothetical protein